LSRRTKEAALQERQTSDVRVRTVLEVLAGRRTVAGAAAQLGVTRQTIYNWRAAFIAGGSERLGGRDEPPHAVAGPDRATTVDALVVAIVQRLRLATAPTELDISTLEAVRQGAGLPVTRFCELTDIPRRTYYTRLASPREARSAPARESIEGALAAVRRAHPEWGARRIWRHLTTTTGADVSLATVKRAIVRTS
jgi:transposase-like protein